MSHNSRSTYEKDSRGRINTYSPTRKQAFNTAKDANNIPRCQSPDRQYTTKDKNTREDLRQWDYTDLQGQKVVIREDKATVYPGGGKQDPHFNVGDDSKQHHYFPKK